VCSANLPWLCEVFFSLNYSAVQQFLAAEQSRKQRQKRRILYKRIKGLAPGNINFVEDGEGNISNIFG